MPAPRSRSGPPRIALRLTVLAVLCLGGYAGGLAWQAASRRPAPDAPRVAFTVDGLDCPVWCAVRLSEGIDGLDGAVVESLDQKTGKVVVRHDPARQNVAALRAVLGARGFPVKATASLDAER